MNIDHHFARNPVSGLLVPARLGARASFGGAFKFRVLDGATREVKHETDWQKNLITDIGLDRLGAGGAFGTYCRIGTGNTTPAFADTALVSQSASTNSVVGSSSSNAGAPDYETETTSTFEFTLGAVVGNMAEIGVGWTASTANTLFSRALILDGGGSPTTISVLITEILQVVYRFTGFPSLADATGTVVIGSDTYDYISRVYSAASTMTLSLASGIIGAVFGSSAFTGNVGAVTAAGPSGSSTSLTAGSFSSYTNGTHYRDFTLSAGLAVGNLSGGIQSINTSIGAAGAVYRSQIQFNNVVGATKIPKDNTKVFGLTLRQSWARH